MPTDDLAQFMRDAEAARQRGDSNTLARLLLMQFVLNCEAEEGRSNAFFSETLRHTFTRLERAEAALREMIAVHGSNHQSDRLLRRRISLCPEDERVLTALLEARAALPEEPTDD